MTIQEMKAKRAAIWEDVKRILVKAQEERLSDLSDEDKGQTARMSEEIDTLTKQIERQEEIDRGDLQFVAEKHARTGLEPETPDGQGDPPDAERRILIPGVRSTPEYRKTFQNFARGEAIETRALQVGSDPAGGYLVPEKIATGLIMALDDEVFMRQLATVIPVDNADSLGALSLDADPADATWTSEILTGTEDSTMAFGKRALHPHPLAKRLKISETLLRQSAIDVEALVIARLTYKFAIPQENAFLNGSGAQQPLGVFTASDDGISTGRDMSTGNTTTAIVADNLIRNKYNIKGGYLGRASWMFHRDGILQIALLKDGEGRYLWQQGLIGNEPDRLLGRPIYMSEYVPSTFTTGLYVGIFGDFSNYWIADALSMTMKKLGELYAETNQIGFIGRMETDGMPVLEEAFTRVKLA